jgi:hypothetical protein
MTNLKPILSDTSFAPITENMYGLHVGITDDVKLQQSKTYHAQFHESLSVCLKVIRGGRHTYVMLLYTWNVL